MLDIATHEGVVCVQGKVSVGAGSMVVYAFLVDGMLVDCGPQSLEGPLRDFYKEQAIEQVALTHHHEDHTGMAAWLERNKGVPLFIHESTVEFCKADAEYPEFRKAFWGRRDAFHPQALGETIRSNKGTWQVLHTPGHADDHVVFLNRETGQLFSGDLFVTPKPKAFASTESVAQIMDSLRKVLVHDFEGMFCCHAGYVPQGQRALHKKLDYLENLAGEILHLHAQGRDVEEIRQELLPEIHPIMMFSAGDFHSRHLIRSVIEELGRTGTRA
jgi:glyoxylase-like metal-dependent hydrolase (beta-lactamase superfamily II)